jgi:hypothetical protein
LVTAVQELTSSAQQARVLALLGSIASAMPGIGFVLGGAVATLADPRLAFVVAGAGVLTVLAAATASLRRVDITPQAPPPDATSVADAGISASAPLSEPVRDPSLR